VHHARCLARSLALAAKGKTQKVEKMWPCREEASMGTTIYLLILVAAFVGIVIWAFGRKRKARFEKDAKIPFDDKKG
jgi:cytochrome c oxidase cbb3-type subunit 4